MHSDLVLSGGGSPYQVVLHEGVVTVDHHVSRQALGVLPLCDLSVGLHPPH